MYPMNLFANNKSLTHLKSTFENAILPFGVKISSSNGSIFKNNTELYSVSKLFAGSHAFNATSNIYNSTTPLNSDDINNYKNLMQIEHLFKDLKLNDISYCFAGLNGNDGFTGLSTAKTIALCNTSNNDTIYSNNSICGIYSESKTDASSDPVSLNYVASTGMLFTINNIFGDDNGKILVNNSNNTIRDVRYAFFGQNSITSYSYLPEFWSISQLSPADRTDCFTGVPSVKNTNDAKTHGMVTSTT